jgi:hypothetical protein
MSPLSTQARHAEDGHPCRFSFSPPEGDEAGVRTPSNAARTELKQDRRPQATFIVVQRKLVVEQDRDPRRARGDRDINDPAGNLESLNRLSSLSGSSEERTVVSGHGDQ